ncbi:MULTISPECIES: acyltransferase [Bacillus cereus group]|uniref:Acyltransferase n=1 Tax=Bacillus paranthracis TaxID=2026186 RepID=A0AAJ1K1I1_9BACI|nr:MULTISPECIES: acyltransferase [Bacillus cereus group]MDA1649385.1 acyltransferase [Bacillus cereus group sp. TH160LC]MDA1799544.1 acyltransferase [Bacillus cereus group sp. BY6-1LC]MDG0950735.1 acyltransferase [Bacillus paranthracis]MDG0952843.1 acyltransferase [Bacillus paranthracis]
MSFKKVTRLKLPSFNKLWKAFASIIICIARKIKYSHRLLGSTYQLKLNPDTVIDLNNGGKCTLGKNLTTESNVQLASVHGGELSIGDNIFFNSNCIIVCRKSVKIGNGTIFGPNVCIFDHDHKFGSQGKMSGYKCSDIEIGENCWIGAGSIILRGSIIGDNCVIGAGCIIKGEIPPNSLVTGERGIKVRPLQ